MNLSFKKAHEDDWGIVQNIFQETIDTSNGLYFANTKKDEVVSLINKAQLYLIMESETPIGVIAYSLIDPKSAYVEELAIRPAYKGKGYGNLAMVWLINHLKNISKLVLVTHPHNTPAIRLYLKHGFRIEGWKDNYLGDGEPRIELVKGGF